MKKSLVILSLLLATTGLESSALNGLHHQDEYCTSQHSSSFTSLEQSRKHTYSNEITSIQSNRHRKNLTASINYSPLMVNGYSPSTRKNNHWLSDGEDEELAPISPDEMDDLAEYSHRESTIERIRRIDRKKTVVVEEVIETKVWYEKIRDDAHVEVFVSGGGFRGGIDPRVHDQLMISNSGLVQKYYESESAGVVEYKRAVSREELFQLVHWIAENGFFEFEREYNCADEDENCLQRLDQLPEPIPLKLVVAIGPYRNVISVPIFSPERTNDFIEYPENLRKIVKAIYDFASL